MIGEYFLEFGETYQQIQHRSSSIESTVVWLDGDQRGTSVETEGCLVALPSAEPIIGDPMRRFSWMLLRAPPAS